MAFKWASLKFELGMVVYAYNSSTGEVKAERFRMQGQPGLSEILF
jgi:hypothetical protein